MAGAPALFSSNFAALCVRLFDGIALQNSVEMEQHFHYVDAFVSCESDQEPENMEPDKCVGWFWRHWTDDFPTPDCLFTGLRLLRETDFDPFEEVPKSSKRLKTE